MGNIPKGYKQAEVGVIPEDWEVKKLGEILQSTQLGGNYHNSEKETSYPLMKMGNINRGTINLSKVEYITEKVRPSEKDKLNFGDVLFNTRNTLDLVGKVAIWKNELPVAYFNSNIMRLEFKQSEIFSNFYMNYVFNTRESLTQLKGIATGTTSVAAIYTRDLLQMSVLLPTKAEQAVIAAALSDADALISSLEKLIAKKRNIKQGAMQQLLKPKEGWVVKKLGEITLSVASGKSNTQSKEGKYPIYGSTGIIGWRNVYDYEGNKILIARVGANAGTVNKVGLQASEWVNFCIFISPVACK